MNYYIGQTKKIHNHIFEPMLSNELKKKIEAQGMSLGIVEEQIKNFKEGKNKQSWTLTEL